MAEPLELRFRPTLGSSFALLGPRRVGRIVDYLAPEASLRPWAFRVSPGFDALCAAHDVEVNAATFASSTAEGWRSCADAEAAVRAAFAELLSAHPHLEQPLRDWSRWGL